MPARDVPDRFRIAISYAGEQHDIVRPIAEALEQALGRSTVFFDKWFEHYISGHDADTRLQAIYEHGCALAVVCVSGEYGKKGWTQTEHEVIRARLLQARKSGDRRLALAILPIRVGPGDVAGVPANAIVQDAVALGTAPTTQLILDRLRLIEPDTPPPDDTDDGWPVDPPALSWPVADHLNVRGAFQALLTRGAPHRLLLIRGPSGSGKSHVTRELESNARAMPEVAVGRFDFKGTTGIEDALQPFVQRLGVALPAQPGRLTDTLGFILERLRVAARPALLIFDTYNDAGGDAQDWFTQQFLPTLAHARRLRVVIAGKSVPNRVGAVWEPVTAPPIGLRPPPPEDWFEWARRFREDVTLEQVKAACALAGDRSGVLSDLLRGEG